MVRKEVESKVNVGVFSRFIRSVKLMVCSV